MKQFLISEQQLQLIANTLLEFPAKQVLNALDLLRALKVFEEKLEPEKTE